MPETTILIGTHYYSRHGGGIELVAGELAKAYASQLNMKVIWVASNCDAPPDESAKLRVLPMASWNGIERLSGLPYPIWSPFGFSRLWAVIGQANVVHIHDFLYFGNILIFLLAAARGKPLLITQHIGFIPYERALLRGILSLLNHTLGAFIMRRSSQVVFISDTVKRYFSAFTRFRKAPCLIPNGLDTTLFHEAAIDERKRQRELLSVPPDRLMFLFVGRFVEKKGLFILKELVREFTDCLWVFAGQGPIDPASWGLPNTRVLPKLSQSELVGLYQAADLLVLPSKGEGFPLVVQESMACGTPAMVGLETATAISGLSGLIMSADSESAVAAASWQAALRTILDQREDLAALRGPVATYARTEWSWQRCAAAYIRELERIQGPEAT